MIVYYTFETRLNKTIKQTQSYIKHCINELWLFTYSVLFFILVPVLILCSICYYFLFSLNLNIFLLTEVTNYQLLVLKRTIKYG